MSEIEVFTRLGRVTSLLLLDCSKPDNREKVKEIMNLLAILAGYSDDKIQELADLKEWVARDIEMSDEMFDRYWRQERVKLYR